MTPPPGDDIRKRLSSITERVDQNERDYGEALRRVTEGQGQIQAVSDRLDELAEQVGRSPTSKDPGTGMARDISELKATVGNAPNDATGTKGTGMAGILADVRAFAAKTQKLAEEQADKPVNLLRKVQTVSAVIGTLVLVGSIFSGCGAVLIWLFKKLPHILGP
jgi:hypothetical protein